MSVKGKAAQQLQSVSAGRSSLASKVSSRFSSTLLLLLVFIVEVGVGIFLLRDLRTTNIEAQRMYAGSVLGLRRIGELQYQSQETRRSTLYALTTADSNLQVEYADQTRAADRQGAHEECNPYQRVAGRVDAEAQEDERDPGDEHASAPADRSDQLGEHGPKRDTDHGRGDDRDQHAQPKRRREADARHER